MKKTAHLILLVLSYFLFSRVVIASLGEDFETVRVEYCYKITTEGSSYFHREEKLNSRGEKKTEYSGKINTLVEIKAEPKNSDKWQVKIAVEAEKSFPIEDDKPVDLAGDSGQKPIVNFKEAFVELDLTDNFQVKVGKRIQGQGAVKFDFLRLNPLERFDYREPFQSLDEGNQLGSWGVSLEREWENFSAELVVNAHSPPIVAMDPEDCWTRDLYPGLEYGDVKSGTDLDVGVNFSGEVFAFERGFDWDAFVFHGSANAIDYTELRGNKVNLVSPKETSLGAEIQTSVAGLNVRAGVAYHNQSGDSDDFVSAGVEAEFVKEGVLKSGDNLFVEVGYANVIEIKDGDKSEPNLDMRRAYEGGTIFGTAEYSPKEDWVAKIRAAWNTENGGTYFSPEISKKVFIRQKELEIFAKAEFVNGSSHDKNDPIRNIFAEHDNDDRVMVGVKILTF